MSEPEMRGYAAAQREWEAREPDHGGPWECAECHGKGYIVVAGDGEEVVSDCTECAGFGFIGTDGKPFDPHAAERAACDYADYKRDQERTP